MESLGKGFILVAVDRQEKVGAPALLAKETGGDGMAAFNMMANEELRPRRFT